MKDKDSHHLAGRGGLIRLKDGEPWVELADGKALAALDREGRVARNQMLRQAAKQQFFINAFDFILNNEIPGDYHEYGCHRVRTFRMALSEAAHHELGDMRFFAFDSFQGLPEAEEETNFSHWKKGNLVTGEEEFLRIVEGHGIYTDRVKTIKGFYNESLTDALAKELGASEHKAALITVDCDLYESARDVFEFVEGFLQEGTQIYIDDYYVGYKGVPTRGVSKAFREFQDKSAFQFEPHQRIGWFGRSFIAYQ